MRGVWGLCLTLILSHEVCFTCLVLVSVCSIYETLCSSCPCSVFDSIPDPVRLCFTFESVLPNIFGACKNKTGSQAFREKLLATSSLH